ncbi:MAG: 3-isopropylmalate dehydratase [Acidobacteriota bacterium]
MKEKILKGKVWIITNNKNELVPDIDTDQIFHNAFLHITEIEKMGQHAFGNLEGWKDFPEKCTSGDIILVGDNFGAGSSRQQAVDCFKALGVSAIIAGSYGAIYKRNAINSGFPIISIESLEELVKNKEIENKDEIELDLLNGKLKNLSNNKIFKFDPLSKVQKDIWEKGSLLKI